MRGSGTKQISIGELRDEFRKRMADVDSTGAVSLPESLRTALATASDIQLAREYLRAATVLHKSTGPSAALLLNPWFQLIGQSLELAFKAAITASGAPRPGGHDLCALCERSEERGIELGDPHARAIVVHVDHIYHKDIYTDEKYAARYGGSGGGIVPEHERVGAIVIAVCDQAERFNRLRFDPTL